MCTCLRDHSPSRDFVVESITTWSEQTFEAQRKKCRIKERESVREILLPPFISLPICSLVRTQTETSKTIRTIYILADAGECIHLDAHTFETDSYVLEWLIEHLQYISTKVCACVFFFVFRIDWNNRIKTFFSDRTAREREKIEWFVKQWNLFDLKTIQVKCSLVISCTVDFFFSLFVDMTHQTIIFTFHLFFFTCQVCLYLSLFLSSS